MTRGLGGSKSHILESMSTTDQIVTVRVDDLQDEASLGSDSCCGSNEAQQNPSQEHGRPSECRSGGVVVLVEDEQPAEVLGPNTFRNQVREVAMTRPSRLEEHEMTIKAHLCR